MGSNLHPFSFFRKELFWMSLLYCILIRQWRELHDLCHRLISDLSCPAHAGCGFFQCKGLIEGSYFLLPLVQCTSFRRCRYTIGIGVPFYGQSGKKKNLLTLSVNVLPFSFFFYRPPFALCRRFPFVLFINNGSLQQHKSTTYPTVRIWLTNYRTYVGL